MTAKVNRQDYPYPDSETINEKNRKIKLDQNELKYQTCFDDGGG